jgi:hypothetical protein
MEAGGNDALGADCIGEMAQLLIMLVSISAIGDCSDFDPSGPGWNGFSQCALTA